MPESPHPKDTDRDSQAPAIGEKQGRRSRVLRWWIAGLLAAGLTAYLVFFNESLTLAALVEQETTLRRWQQEQPWLIYGVAGAIYVLVTALSIPGASGLTLAYGWYFGFLRAFPLVSFASTAGATLAFLLSRFLFYNVVVRKFGERLQAVNHRLEQDGAIYLFTLRLIPIFPFFIVNAVMGLTSVRTWTFWWVSQLGMLPATALYVYAGSQAPSLKLLAEDRAGAAMSAGQLTRLLIAFALLGVFPWLVRFAVRWFWPEGARKPDV